MTKPLAIASVGAVCIVLVPSGLAAPNGAMPVAEQNAMVR